MASSSMWVRTIKPGEELELDEFKSRQALDEFLVEPVGREAKAEQALIRFLGNG